MEIINRSGSMEGDQDKTEFSDSLEIIDEELVIDTAQVWKNKLISVAYLALSTVVAYVLIASFVLIES